MRRILMLSLATVLSGCGVWSGTIRSEVVDYSNAIEETTDQFLLINILEARDDAPLHFVAIPNVHGSLQANATLSSALSLPLKTGYQPGGVVSQTLTPSASVQSAPSFEVDSVETKDFVTGMTSPIDAKYIKYWVDRGLDKRLILLLFFSSAQITENIYKPIPGDDDCAAPAIGKKNKSKNPAAAKVAKPPVPDPICTKSIVVFNNPRAAADQLTACKDAKLGDLCHRRTQFEHYLTLADTIRNQVSANSYSERKVLSEPFPLDLSRNLRAVSTLDPTKLKLVFKDNKKYVLYGGSGDENVVLCYNKAQALNPVGRSDDATKLCELSVVDKQPEKVIPKNTPDQLIAPPQDDPKSSGDCSTSPPVTNTTAPPMDYCAILDSFICYAEANAYAGKIDDTNRHDPCVNKKLWVQDQFTLQFNTRSVGEMIRFLGDLVYYQKKLGASDSYHNIPVTIGYVLGGCSPAAYTSDLNTDCRSQSGGWLFNLNEDSADGRVSVRYRDHTYSLPEHKPYDHSLEVLSIVNQLVNLNKSAADLRTTPTVQVVP